MFKLNEKSSIFGIVLVYGIAIIAFLMIITGECSMSFKKSPTNLNDLKQNCVTNSVNLTERSANTSTKDTFNLIDNYK